MKFFPTTEAPKTHLGTVLEFGNHLAAKAVYLTVLPYFELYMEFMGMSLDEKEKLRQTPTYELMKSGFKTSLEGSLFCLMEIINWVDNLGRSSKDSLISVGKERFTEAWKKNQIGETCQSFKISDLINHPLQSLNEFSPKTPEESMKQLGVALGAFCLLTLAALALPDVCFALEMFYLAGELALIATAIIVPLAAAGAALFDAMDEMSAEAQAPRMH